MYNILLEKQTREEGELLIPLPLNASQRQLVAVICHNA
jgi:hypothetical protein